jgi:D-alanyl-D-alanine carboxypeptidase
MSQTVDTIGADIIHDGRTPGLAIGIVEDGRVVYARGFGNANVARHLPFQASTETYVGQISEQFTAGAILLLEQDGKLKLDDKVTKYIPELTIAKDVTIRELLNQTSGLPDISKASGINTDHTKSIKMSDLIAAANAMQSLSAPGKAYRYNDFNYMVAGLVVERAANVPLSDYLQQHIFMPLVMNESFYAGDLGISPGHAIGYTGSPNNFKTANTWDPAWLYGANGLVTNVYDIAKWDIDMPVLLRDDAVREMFTPAGVPGQVQYGLGWTIDQRDGKRYVWQNGDIPGYNAMNALLPDDHIAVIVVANTDDMASPAVIQPEAVAARVLDIIAPPAVTHLDNAIVQRAREWLERIADHRIDRTQLTPEFSDYLSDSLVAKSNFASLGKLQTIVPISSSAGDGGSTVYEFLVRYPHEQYHYRLSIMKDGKIDGIVLVP